MKNDSKNGSISNGGQSYFRDRNILLVANNLYTKGPITKKSIVEETGLSFAKVNSIILSLSGEGIAVEDGKEDSNGGRPSAIYKINENYGYIVGCELSHTRIHTIISNLNGEVITGRENIYDKSAGKDSIIKQIIKSIRDSINDSKIDINKFLGVGFAIAGLVNPAEGTGKPFPHLVDWGDIYFQKIIKNEFNLDSYVENIANSAALAEFNFGIGRESPNILFLDVGTGVGMGIILKGELYEGSTGSAGEFGHITVDENGPLCECGNVGCIEAIASTNAVIKRAKSFLEKGVISHLNDEISGDLSNLNFEMICKAADNGDKLSYNLLDDMGKSLGEGIVTLINLFNPERIILGDQLNRNCPVVLDSISNIVQKRALEVPRRKAEIVYSQLEKNAAAIGATIPFIKKFFSTPFHHIKQ